MTRAAYYLTAFYPSFISRFGHVVMSRDYYRMRIISIRNFIFESDHFKYKISVISQSSILSFRLKTQINKIQTTTLGFIQSFLSKKKIQKNFTIPFLNFLLF